MNGELIWVLSLLLIAIILFATGKVRMDAVALFVIVAFVLSGTLTLPEAFSGFSDPNVILIAALFIIGDGLVRTGVATIMGSWLVKVAGSSETKLLVLPFPCNPSGAVMRREDLEPIAEVLRGTLSLYNWREDELNNRRLDAILAVSHHRIQRFEQGFLLRGLDIEVTLDGSGFTGAGDVHLFGDMLNRFFALYADIHLFTQLTLILQPTGKCLQWTEHHSQRVPG